MAPGCLQVFAWMALCDFLIGRHSCRSLLLILLLFYLLMVRIDLEGVCDALAGLASR